MADQAVVLSAVDAPARRVQTGHRFYIGFGVFVILLSFAGFAPSLIDQSRRFAPPTTLHLVHGATALAWLLLYVTQALLVAKGRVDLHRRLGWAGLMVAVSWFCLGTTRSPKEPFASLISVAISTGYSSSPDRPH